MPTENPFEPPQVDDREEMGFMSPGEKITIVFTWVLALLFLAGIAFLIIYFNL